MDSEPIIPIPIDMDFNQDKVALGKKLFEDPYLSHDKKQSCAQCHILKRGGDDDLRRSMTNKGEDDVINTPTIFNVRFNVRHTWRGKFKTLEMQAQGDLHNLRHANTTWKELIPKLKKRADYVERFQQIYGKKINKDLVLDAIAVYEKSLITPNAPFDRFLKGDKEAISQQAIDGYQLFKSYGCISCHQGVNIGGNMFQKLGVFGDYFADRGNITQADYGLFNVTGLEQDRYVFRVPSLRNIAVTAPYFHDGQTKTLDDAVDVVAKYQLGRILNKRDKLLIVEFLKTLTGQYQGHSLMKKSVK